MARWITKTLKGADAQNWMAKQKAMWDDLRGPVKKRKPKKPLKKKSKK